MYFILFDNCEYLPSYFHLGLNTQLISTKCPSLVRGVYELNSFNDINLIIFVNPIAKCCQKKRLILLDGNLFTIGSPWACSEVQKKFGLHLAEGTTSGPFSCFHILVCSMLLLK